MHLLEPVVPVPAQHLLVAHAGLGGAPQSLQGLGQVTMGVRLEGPRIQDAAEHLVVGIVATGRQASVAHHA